MAHVHARPDASVAFTHISSAAAAALTTALPLAFAEKDHPAIRFNTRESVEIPFRASYLTMDMTFIVSGHMVAPGPIKRCVRDRVEAVTIPSCAASPISHIHLRSATTPPTSASTKPPNPATHAPRDVPSFDIVGEERLLRDIVEEALAQDV
ncbi:hypothetical protein EDB86DRAFT_3081730 [Lactarius hatsudake]|nr:hypothetical protein EDB86DRAFT_3081730 [Lactarius hatsudake]